MTQQKSPFKMKKYKKGLLLYFKDAKWSFIIIAGWFLMGAIYFALTQTGATVKDIILMTFYMKEPIITNNFVAFYNLFGSIVVLQGILQIMIGRSMEKANPTMMCREIAKDIKRPYIVVHHGHVGSRITDFLREHKKKYIVIEEEEELVDGLLEAGEPVIVEDPLDEHAWDDVDVKNAKAVFLCEDDPKETIILASKIRKINKKVPMVVRVFEDEIREMLEQDPFNATCFSTSKTTLTEIKELWLDSSKKGKVVIIGIANFTRLLAMELNKMGRKVVVVDTEETELDYFNGTSIKAVEGDGSQMQLLESPEVGIQTAQQVFFGIKNELKSSIVGSVNIKKKYPNIDVYVRLFDDDLAEFLERLGIKTFSTSKYMIEILKKKVLEKIMQ